MENVASEGEQAPPPPDGPPPPTPAAERLTAARVALYTYLGQAGAQLSRIARLERWVAEVSLLCGGAVLLAVLRAVAPSVDARSVAVLFVGALAVGLFVASRAAHARLSGGYVAGELAKARPRLGDELRSFVELDELSRSGQLIEGEAFLVLLGERMRGLCASVPVVEVLPHRAARQALLRTIALSLLGLGLVHLIAPRLLPEMFAAVRYGRKAPPAALIPPIVGDLELVLTPPPYTGLPTRSIPASAGDIRALPGTEVTIRARSLVGAVRRAELRVDLEGAPPSITRAEVKPSIDGAPVLNAHFVVDKAGSYQFVLWRWTGRLAEPSTHRIDLEPDLVPRVELRAPADPLELSGPRPVELLYEVEDDFGVRDVSLVWQVGEGEPQRKLLTPEQPTPRRARGRFLWELGELEREGPLPPGAHIAYWIEAHDDDRVAGPQLGKSPTLSIILRGKHDPAQTDKVGIEALVEATLAALADRLDHTGTDSQRHAALQALAERYAAVATQEAEAGKKPLSSTATLRKLALEISRRLAALVPADAQDAKGAASSIITELEHDVLSLDDLRGKRRLEQMARVGEEMQQTRDELKRLFEELKTATSDAHKAELKREIERKLVELEAKMAELRKLAQDAEGEVPDEFLNRDAIAKQDVRKDVDSIRKMLERGDLDKAQQELERMSKSLDKMQKSMKDDLQGFKGERDPEAEKAMSQLQNDLADLAKEERDVERESRSIRERGGEEADRKADLAALREKLRPKLAELERRIADQMRESQNFDNERLDRLRQRTQAIGRALEANDLEESKEMASDAHHLASEMDKTLRDIESQLEQEAQARVGDGPPASLKRARARMSEAAQIAGQIEAELKRVEAERRARLSEGDRSKLDELAQKQRTLQQRAEELGKRMQSDTPGMGGLPRETQDDIGAARGLMGEAQRHLGQPAPGRAADAARQAAEKLDAAGQKLADARKNGGGGGGNGDGNNGERDQPVKIPGADDSAAPRAFREELLDAMKRGAPRKFEDQVRQYYEELVR